MYATQAVNNRTTEHIIIVTFQNWKETILYDSRKTPYDIPSALAWYPVLSTEYDNDLTIIEI